ncbi:formate/nitrite transporter family protein [Desulfopila sp. IMCC35006]|uniref:formate/nitrite transporter family protein n=1 Tax=Desulfopila sp. IMCC35006 TaxID=2569542 RepID=UPI001F0FEB6C|nr:formate/nitrite transporter family protein [Desulfopila sp. IMCC35006]
MYVANFLGAILLALLFYFSGLWKAGGNALGKAAVKIAVAKVNLDVGEAFVRAVGCNWMVCLAVWMAVAPRQVIGEIFAIFFPTMGFVAIGIEHCVANMYFIPSGIFLSRWACLPPAGVNLSTLTWSAFFLNNIRHSFTVFIFFHFPCYFCVLGHLGLLGFVYLPVQPLLPRLFSTRSGFSSDFAAACLNCLSPS